VPGDQVAQRVDAFGSGDDDDARDFIERGEGFDRPEHRRSVQQRGEELVEPHAPAPARGHDDGGVHGAGNR